MISLKEQIFHKLLIASEDIMQTFIRNNIAIMLVGGAVRDCIFTSMQSAMPDMECSDMDLSVEANPQDVIKILSKGNFRIITNGIDFGSLKVIDEAGNNFEITSLRKDVKCSGRKAVVEFGGTFFEDSVRRDFTINAIYLDHNGKIYDFHNSLADLKNGIVKFIGCPEDRIKEDYLRIMRFFRFSGKFATSFDENGLKAISALNHGLKIISSERITNEILAIIILPKVHLVLRKMQNTGTLQAIFGNDWHLKFHFIEFLSESILKAKTLKCNYVNTAILALAMDSNHPQAISNVLSLSREQAQIVNRSNELLKIALCENDNIQDIVKSLLSNYRKDAICALCLNKNFSSNTIMQIIEKTAKMPISGDDIIRCMPGVSGIAIGKLLTSACNIWIQNNLDVDKEFLMKEITKLHNANNA